MESGVRNLERAVGSLCRTVAYRYATSTDMEHFKKVLVDDDIIKEALGNPKFDFNLNERVTRPGIAIGLAYTEVGGRALLIETSKYPGSGRLNLTGKLGDVMKESVNTSLSWIKANATKIGIFSSSEQLKNEDHSDDNHY
jgi:ATP-dependent Lon protease